MFGTDSTSGVTIERILFGLAALALAVTVAHSPSPAVSAQPPEGAPANVLGEVSADSVFATTMLVLPMSGTYAQHGEAITKLMMYAAPKGILRGMPLGIYHNSPEGIPEDSLRWEICVPVAPDAAAEPPFEIRKQPDLLAAGAVCTGPYAGASACLRQVMEWIAAHGYTPAGPAQEHWLSDPSSVPPEKQEARIVVPIEPASKE